MIEIPNPLLEACEEAIAAWNEAEASGRGRAEYIELCTAMYHLRELVDQLKAAAREKS